MIDGEAVAKCHPETMALVNMLKSDEGFQVDDESTVSPDGPDKVADFFAPHMDEIERLIDSGYSKSKIFDAIPGHGQRSDKNPKWVWFSETFDQVKARLIEAA